MTVDDSVASVAGTAPNAIFVAGFMGSGKSTVGRAVASRLGWSFVDLDDEIERAAGLTIPEIFESFGEQGFRDREHRALRGQAALGLVGNRFVLALGGGTYAYPRNRDLLRRIGPTLWIDVDADTLWKRVRGATHRPLARDPEAFKRLHASRNGSYSKAEHRIDGAGPVAEVVAAILGLGWMQDLLADA